jgi:hypothetical protein
MSARLIAFAGMAAAAVLVSACQSDGDAAAPADGVSATGGTTGSGGAGDTTTGTGTGTGTGGIPALVNVNLENVLNNLSVQLSVDRANIPVNAQVPIDVAANVCGVSVSALSASIASGQAGCTATTTSPQLVQSVQQQVAAGGNVGGGDQSLGSPTSNNM